MSYINREKLAMRIAEMFEQNPSLQYWQVQSEIAKAEAVELPQSSPNCGAKIKEEG